MSLTIDPACLGRALFRSVRGRLLTLLAILLVSVLGTNVGTALAAAPSPAATADEAGFKPLFDGRTLEGWDGNPKFWSVQDGAITGRTTAENPTRGNTFLIWRQGPVDDFELRLTYRIVGGNSGIQYRSQDLGDWVVGGYQGDFEAGDMFSGILYEERMRGVLANRGQKAVRTADGKNEVAGSVGDSAQLQAAIKKEDWNDYTIVARGNHLIHKINGNVTIDFVDNETAKAQRSGILALQLHAGPAMTVQFKNVRLKRLPLEDRKKIVLVAGHPSHGPGDHEFNAGVTLLKRCLDKTPGVLAVENHDNGWPQDPTAFDNADAVLLFMDGGSGHPLIAKDHLEQMAALIKRGVGLACVHYAVEIPKDHGGPELLDWIGGYYETGYSINPHWVGKFDKLPEHAIARGVKPFEIRDEWYYNIRFRPDGVQPLLISTPPDNTRGTPAAKEHPGRPEIVAWAYERPAGGRGFGFTGAHFHRNWGNDDFRKLILNALIWTAGMEVPTDGFASKVTEEELKANLDPK